MEVWFAGRGGSVEGFALTSIRSSLVKASPEIGSVPFSSAHVSHLLPRQ
jgi:hypothetical protein